MDTVYKALADPSRRKILEILKDGDMTVNEIGRHFPFSGATLSHHLDTLKRANLVVAQRQGQYIEYSLNTSVFEEVVKALIGLFGKE
ncbi:transcriptional regulator [Candidatus Gottesmanbacteria bacterium RBG_16_52_11]|uniref:Transcriptional regulator n=1 Tax=Candidatus Gottesmanbacteria bacterium RBG_16_52_11 TaxID=1798374 RepID=A0A1F5YXI8_9BACT|nr:MAG: transcriptional regulator [Candidatus Gottesmanbacteria bacterium RBG_16_52_11]